MRVRVQPNPIKKIIVEGGVLKSIIMKMLFPNFLFYNSIKRMWVCEVKFGQIWGGSVNQIKQISQNCIIFLKASINDCPEDIASVMGCHYSCVT